MSIYDRDYYNESEYRRREPRLHIPQMMPWTLRAIIANLVIFFIIGIPSSLSPAFGRFIRNFFMLNDFGAGWYPWQLISWAFLHVPSDPGHVIGNMVVLFFLSSSIERLYPGKKFLSIYLSAAVFAGLAVVFTHLIQNPSMAVPTLGASGVCYTIMVLFALNFPNLMFFGVIPAWIFIGLLVSIDVYTALAGLNSGIALSAHLGGALYGYLVYRYFDYVWNLNHLLAARRQKIDRKNDSDMRLELDRILDKINKEGLPSLTEGEKRTLKKTSDRFRNE